MLVDLSEYRISAIASSIVNAIDDMSRSSYLKADEQASNDLMCSQLFLLRVLSSCMQNHWNFCQKEKVSQEPSQQPQSVLMHGRPTVDEFNATMSGNWLLARNSPSMSVNPPPLEENLANHILHIMSRFVHQIDDSHEKHSRLVINHSTLACFSYSADNAPVDNIKGCMYEAASRIISYISASNWNIVFSNIKSCLLNSVAGVEETPEMMGVILLECASLDSKRLSEVLKELCNCTLNLKKPAQQLVAITLRRAIWHWLENYTAEFVLLCRQHGRIDGSPEILFDIFNSLADTTARKAIFWPVQTMLLVLCPDMMLSSSLIIGHKNNKKSAFFELLRKAMKGEKMAELAAVCYVDLLRAATYASEEEAYEIRQIVPDVENELMDKLFTSNRSTETDFISNSLGIYIDRRNLKSDCIVAMFRLDIEKTVNTIIPACFDSSNRTLLKLSIVKAAVAMASEENRLPWVSTISSLYNPLCQRIRTLFLELVDRDLREKTNSNTTQTISSKKVSLNSIEKRINQNKRDISSSALEHQEIILDILILYQIDPQFAILGDNYDRPNQNAATILAITNCLTSSSSVIRHAASNCLHKLHRDDLILQWGKSDQHMDFFWKISSEVLFAIAKQLLDTVEGICGTPNLLDLLKRILVLRNSFLEKHRDLGSCELYARERIQVFIGLEVALLISLCSSDSDECTIALDCFGLLCIELRLTERLDEHQLSSNDTLRNVGLYFELSQQSEVVGKKSQQRQIRRILREIKHSSPGMLSAWEEAWNRWKIIMPSIIRISDDNSKEEYISESIRKNTASAWHDKLRSTTSLSSRQTAYVSLHSARFDILDDDKSTEWLNYAGFLAALGGVCLMTPSQYESLSSATPKSQTSAMHLQKKRLSPFMDTSAMIDKFVMEMVELLACRNLIVREWAQEILGIDLSPSLYHVMFHHLESTVSKCFNTSDSNSPNCEPRHTLFVEQAISVLKQVLDRLDHESENIFTVDFSTLIDQYAMYLNRLKVDYVSLKIKIKMCQLVEVLMRKKESVTLRQELKLRNKLLEIIVEWTSDFCLKHDNTNQSFSFETIQLEKIQGDLDVACLRTIVALIHHLPLQPSVAIVDSDTLSVRSKIFYKYFTYFLKLLNRCRVSETESISSQARSSDYQLRSSLNLAPLKNYAILALSNLLSANVDAGLKYSFAMGYHEDVTIRSAFMQVLTNILNQGTEFETLADTLMTDRYEKLIDMLTQDEFIVLSLCDMCPSSVIDDVSTVLLACFTSRNKVMQLLKTVIRLEVQKTENETDLFRKTSIATRILSLYTKKKGDEYLKLVLLPVFQKLSERLHDDRCFEIDPSKVSRKEDIRKNRENVMEATEMFLTAICSSLDKAPHSFREVCNCILVSVIERFPEARYTAVGSFVFLRFFCPAIVSPDTEGLIKKSAFISREMRRGLLIATKIIQNLANNVLFGAKETYMIVLNDFLTTNIYKVASFLREISKAPEEAVLEESIETIRLDDKTYSLLHRILYNYINTEGIPGNIVTQKLNQLKSQNAINKWKRDHYRFSTLLVQLGRPIEITQKHKKFSKSYVSASSNQLYTEFMRRNSNRNVDSVASKNIFYEGGLSRAGRPVFYLIMHRILADSIDFELLVYHALQILEATSNRQHELLIDTTLFCRSNEIPVQWVNQLLQLLGDEKLDKIAVCYIYNPNSYLRTYTKKLARPIPHRFTKRVIFATSLAELQESIASSEVKLPKFTINLETDSNMVFFPVSKVLKYGAQVPVTFKISAEFIQITSVRKQEIYYGLNTVVNDVWHISEIDDITSIHSQQKLDEIYDFSCRCTRDNAILTFSSPKRDAILGVIHHKKRIYDMARPTNISERIIQPSDVPGRLLNMALLNLGSKDPNLRLSSYNLLYALSNVFNFDVRKQLMNAEDLCLPSNSTDFIVDISEKIAKSEPFLTLEFLNECIVGFEKSEQSSQ